MSSTGCYAPDAMAQQDTAPTTPSSGDPWHAFGYLVAGVAFYGMLGWLCDRWLGTSFLVGVGIVIGASLGIYATWSRFTITDPTDAPPPTDVSNQEKP